MKIKAKKKSGFQRAKEARQSLASLPLEKQAELVTAADKQAGSMGLKIKTGARGFDSEGMIRNMDKGTDKVAKGR